MPHDPRGRSLTETDASGAGLDHDRWLVAEQKGQWDLARVVAVHPDVSATTLRLRLAETPELLSGQHYLIRLAIEVPPGTLQQAYSLSSSPFPPSPEVEITVRAVEGGRASPLLARRVQVGDFLQVQGPYGFLTWTEHDGGPVVLIGAGSGVAPLVSIVRYAATRLAETPMTMLCSSRDRATVLLRKPLESLSRRYRWFTLVHTFTRSSWDPYARHHRGIDAAMLAEMIKNTRAEVPPALCYVAGPADMVLTVRAELGDLGVPDARIYSEDHA